MKATPIKTPLVKVGDDLTKIIASSISSLEENSVITIASKVFSFAENRMVPITNNEDKNEKWELAKKEADFWLDPNESKFQCMLTIKGNWMFVNSGIDESNSEGKYYSLWPKDPQKSLNKIWMFLREHYKVKNVGVIMTDSRSMPLSWGVVGHGICYCGFEPLYSYIDKPDLHGRLMEMERVSMVQSLAVTGVTVMGEGNERTPIAVITDIPNISFVNHEPTKEEVELLKPSLEDDIYAPLLTNVKWNKGGGGK